MWEDPELYQIWTVNQTNQSDCPKETQKKYPIKVIQTTLRAWLSNSGTLPLNLPVCVSTHTVLFFPLINTLLAMLLSIFVEFLFYKAEVPGPLSLTTCLLSRIWCFHHYDPVQFLAGNISPTLSHCRLNPPEIMFMSMGLLLPLIFSGV